MMRRLAYVAAVLPALALLFWRLVPQADPTFAAPLFHFYIVSFTTFAATVVSLFVAISVGETALPRHLLLAMAFAWMGGIFFVHGLTTPGALIEETHPGLVWGAWLTLFGGGVIFFISGLAPNTPNPRLLQLVGLGALAAYLLFGAAAVALPGLLTFMLELQIAPTLADLVFVITVLVWLGSSARHFINYRQSHNFFDGLMTFESAWYATASVSLFKFPVWNLSWWLYHLLLLGGFLIAIYALWRAYEQIRAFRLTRYYAATSLIVTAALALLAAQVYALSVYNSLVSQLERDSGALSENLAHELAGSVPEVTTADQLRQLTQRARMNAVAHARLPDMHLTAVTVYASDGTAVFSTMPAEIGSAIPSFETMAAALQGQTSVVLHAPEQPPATYAPASRVHVLMTYAPYRPGGDETAAPIGMVAVAREAPELAQALTLSRRTGIGVAALSLGGLFLALLVIVRRADQLIQNRAAELERAYIDLRAAQAMRDDLTNMIVHDLRNPLTAITANLDLIDHTLHTADEINTSRFLASARGAGSNMTGLIDDLLNVGKLEAGELRPNLAPLDVQKLVADKESAYRAQAEKEKRHLTITALTAIPPARADAALIGRVLDNLVSNAFKYTDPDGHIDIILGRRGPQVTVKVRDDGEGIPPEFHGRIFQKFGQATDPRGQPLRKGTGLGLTFCRLAVEAHGGTIRVDSLPGQGSEFTFTLPANE